MSGEPRPDEMPVLRREGLRRRLERVVSLGNRFAGSAGEARCRDLLLGQLAAAGLANVRAEQFQYLGYESEGSLCLLVEDGWSIPCVALQYTADEVIERDGEPYVLAAQFELHEEWRVDGRFLDIVRRFVVAARDRG